MKQPHSSTSGRTWAPLFGIMGLTLIIANFGAGMGAQIGAARLLFGMGRSGALPKSFFGAIEPKRRIPRNNVLFVGVLALAGSFVLNYDLGAEMLNFGALIAFMGVNLAAIMRFYIRERSRKLTNLFPPLIGLLVCFVLWLNLSRAAHVGGGIWLLIGIAFGIFKTRGFRGSLVNFEIPTS